MSQPPTIYRDHDNLYLEWPTLVLKFPFTEGGMSKVLKHIPNIGGQRATPSRMASNIVDLRRIAPKVAKSTQRKRAILKFSPEQRNAAKDIVRKMRTK